MKRRGVPFAALAVLALMLTGCGLNVLNSQGVQWGIDPAPLGYEVDDQGRITITSHQMIFQTKPGRTAATIHGYRAYFFDELGNPVHANDNVIYSEGSLGVYVPAGLRCTQTDPEIGCTINSPGVEFVPGPVVRSQSVALLPGGVASAMERYALENGEWVTIDDEDVSFFPKWPVGWHAEIELYGEDSSGRSFVLERQRFNIIVPLGN